MAYLTSELISEAYYLADIVAEEEEIVSGNQMVIGLRLLNALIAMKTADKKLIPYFSFLTFPAIIGTEIYFIPNLIYPETVTFNLQQVRFSLDKTLRKKYFGNARIDGLTTLPGSSHIERTLGGCNLYLYPLPAETYPINIVGKFSLASVTLDQDLSLTLDAFYIEYLRFALAEYLCTNNSISMQPQAAKKLMQYEANITDVSPPDLSVSKKSSLNGDYIINWAYAAFGRGFWP
jgi:hypothetical protein